MNAPEAAEGRRTQEYFLALPRWKGSNGEKINKTTSTHIIIIIIINSQLGCVMPT
jgi:hypothetical protein